MISELTWRTQLVEDTAVIAVIDAEMADKATPWGPLSEVFLARAVDAVIERYDPKAVRRAQEVIRRPSFDDNASGAGRAAGATPNCPARTAMMPRRRRTRAADEAARIKAERAQNSSAPQNSPY